MTKSNETYGRDKKHCCEMMSENIEDPEVPVIYVPRFRDYGIQMADAVGGGFIAIEYCPWCGKKLPKELGSLFFNELRQMGLELDSPELPHEYRTDEWWRKRGL